MMRATKEWRSESDLEAQWNMAEWTFAAAIAAWFGLVVTIIGVILVRQTLQANREAVKQAQRSADISEEAFRRLERPYLFIKIIETHKLAGNLSGKNIIPSIEFTLVNYGKLPAILRSISIGLLNNPTFPLVSTFKIFDPRYAIIVPGDSLLNPRSLEVEAGQLGQNFRGASATNLYLYGLLEYDDPTGARHADSFLMRGIFASLSLFLTKDKN